MVASAKKSQNIVDIYKEISLKCFEGTGTNIKDFDQSEAVSGSIVIEEAPIQGGSIPKQEILSRSTKTWMISFDSFFRPRSGILFCYVGPVGGVELFSGGNLGGFQRF